MQTIIWDQLISLLPNPHFLQTYEWAQVKSKYGWKPIYLIWSDKSFQSYTSDQLNQFDHPEIVAACLVLKRTISFRGLFQENVLYAPKGPLLNWNDQLLRNRVLDDLQSFAKKQGAIFLKIAPCFFAKDCKSSRTRLRRD